MNLFDEPVSLKGTKLVRAFAEQLKVMPEEYWLAKESFDLWSTPLAETGASESQMAEVGAWYVQHHRTAPALPRIIVAARTLVSNGSLPSHRIASRLEKDALAILKAAEALGMSADNCAQALILAGTLAHLSVYRRRMPSIDRSYQGSEIAGIANMSDYVADEILDEISHGRGELVEVREFLLGQSMD